MIVHTSRITKGFGEIRKNILAFNNACLITPYLVLTDLDNNACAPGLIIDWMQNRYCHQQLWFRVAVREVEAWLLAHRQAIADFFQVQINLIPQHPEQLPDPKRELIALATRCRNASRRKAIVPIGMAKQGPDYNSEMLMFVRDFWNPEHARQFSESLDRAIIKMLAIIRE